MVTGVNLDTKEASGAASNPLMMYMLINKIRPRTPKTYSEKSYFTGEAFPPKAFLGPSA
jgi:hypothetical protein